MSERRREERNSCYLKAELIVSPTQPPVPAEAYDISEQGFRIKVADTSGIPDEFILVIPRRHLRETVHVRRRSADELGVILKRFLSRVA